MRVGVDIDGVIYDWEKSLRLWRVNARGIDPETMPVSDIWEVSEKWGISREELVSDCEAAVAAGWMFNRGTPINDARHQLLRLRNTGHSIHIITARDFGPMTQPNTHRWFQRYSIPFDTMDFSHDKTIRPLDVMIDDKPGNIEALLDVGVDAYLQDRPYNQDYHYGKRVYSLRDFVDRVIASEDATAA